MSEQITSKTAEGEALQPQPSLLEKARGILGKPIGKFIGGAMIVGAVAGTTKEAVADTIACVSKTPETSPDYSSLMVGKLGEPFGENIIGSESNWIYQDGLDILNNKIFSRTYGSPGARYTVYNHSLGIEGAIDNKDEVVGGYFIPNTDLRLGNNGTTIYQINDPDNPTEFLLKGALNVGGSVTLNSITANDTNLFVNTAEGLSGIQNAKLYVIDRETLENSVDSPIEIDDIQFGTGGAFFIDMSGDIIFSYKNDQERSGYITIDPSSGIGIFKDINDIVDGLTIKTGCSGQIDGNRYLLTEADQNGDSHIIIIDSNDDLITTVTVKPVYTRGEPNPMKPLRDEEGILIIEEGAKYPTKINSEGKKLLTQNASTDSYPLNECAVFEEDPYIDPCIVNPDSDGCQIGDNTTSDDVVEVSEDVIESDTGTDTQSEDVIEETDEGTDPDIQQDVIEDTGTDTQEDVSEEDVTTPDTSNDEGGRDDGVQDTDTATPDTGEDGSTEPVDVIDTDTTVEGGKGGGCSSVPGGVAGTRGSLALLLAGLAALGIKRRKAAAAKAKEQ